MRFSRKARAISRFSDGLGAELIRQIGYTNSDGEDASGVSGWSIANNRHRIVGGAWGTASTSLRITINGQARAVGTPITATLEELAPVEGEDGRRRHNFDLKLSEPVLKSFRKMRERRFHRNERHGDERDAHSPRAPLQQQCGTVRHLQ